MHNVMEKDIQYKIDKTLDFISKDREVMDDPFMSTRLLARLEATPEPGPSAIWFRTVKASLKPVLATVVIGAGLAAGILAGRVLSTVPGPVTADGRGQMLEQYAADNFITEVNGTSEEQMLVIK